MTIQHSYLRGKAIYWQRQVPPDLRDRYGARTIKKALKTTDPVRAAKLIAKLDREIEDEWEGLRAAPESSPNALKAHGAALLKSFGIVPGASEIPPMAVTLLHDHMDHKRMLFADGDEALYREADPADYLTPAEREAGRLLHGSRHDTLNDALRVYLEANRKRDDAKFVTFTTRAFRTLVAVVGDKDIAACTRSDARSYVTTWLEKGNKTATIRRRLNVLIAVWNAYRREKAPGLINPFEKIEIPGEGADSEARVPFSAEELLTLFSACREADDDVRWIAALLADTGARLAEVVGLPLTDIHLDDPDPSRLLSDAPVAPHQEARQSLESAESQGSPRWGFAVGRTPGG